MAAMRVLTTETTKTRTLPVSFPPKGNPLEENRQCPLRIDQPSISEFTGARRESSIGGRILSDIALITARLEPAEWRRRFWHCTPGFLPFILWGIPHSDPLSLRARAIFVALISGLAITIYRRYDRIRRRGDHGEQGERGEQRGAVLGYAGTVLLTLLLLPAHAEIGLAVLAVLAFGDGSATLFGTLLRGAKLPWNRDKTWAGSLAFLLIGMPMASIIYWGESHNLFAQTPGVSVGTAMICGGLPVLVAAFAESVVSRINDNIRVAVTAAVTAIAAHAMMVGL